MATVGEADGVRGEVALQLERHRALRSALEREVLPLATSLDGRRFRFQASLYGLNLVAGSYVALQHDDGRAIGQVHALGIAEETVGNTGGATVSADVRLRIARGEGVVIGESRPFHDAVVETAAEAEVERALDPPAQRAALPIGRTARPPHARFALDSGGFNRHTVFIGQSGSGKTYALGVVLERLLTETSLRVVILDPNSDYVRLGVPRDGAGEDAAARHRALAGSAVVVRSPPQLRFGELDRATQAALLRLDPIADADDYATVVQHLADARPQRLEELARHATPELASVLRRAQNLGLLDLGVWAHTQGHSVLDDLRDPDLRCVVIDLGRLATLAEQALVSAAVFSRLWETRSARQPLLLVADEAHNACPAAPADAIQAIAARRAISIAAEGRKFGLYLLLATQRPQKLDPDVLTQCDNAFVMRLNSDADATLLRTALSFVPAGLLGEAPAFLQGESVVAGKVARHAAIVRFGGRVSEEGGADLPDDWAARHTGLSPDEPTHWRR